MIDSQSEPALARVSNQKLAIAVYTNEGEVIQAGDADEAFSVQSISKALSRCSGPTMVRAATSVGEISR